MRLRVEAGPPALCQNGVAERLEEEIPRARRPEVGRTSSEEPHRRGAARSPGLANALGVTPLTSSALESTCRAQEGHTR
jgi:hypothetical protein